MREPTDKELQELLTDIPGKLVISKRKLMAALKQITMRKIASIFKCK